MSDSLAQQYLKAMYEKVQNKIEAYKAIHDLSDGEYEKRMQRLYAEAFEKMKKAYQRIS